MGLSGAPLGNGPGSSILVGKNLQDVDGHQGSGRAAAVSLRSRHMQDGVPRVMMKTLISFAFAAACVAVLPSAHAQIVTEEGVTTPPKASPGDFGDWDARRNIIESRHYDLLLQTNP